MVSYSYEENILYARQNVHLKIHYHIVWCVKYRRKVLSPDIESELQAILKTIGQENDFIVEKCEVGEADHVHCFISAPPKISVTFIVKHLKGTSAIKLFKSHPELRKKLWRGQLWNGSYFVETIGSTSEDNIRRYIDRKKNVQM